MQPRSVSALSPSAKRTGLKTWSAKYSPSGASVRTGFPSDARVPALVEKTTSPPTTGAPSGSSAVAVSSLVPSSLSVSGSVGVSGSFASMTIFSGSASRARLLPSSPTMIPASTSVWSLLPVATSALSHAVSRPATRRPSAASHNIVLLFLMGFPWFAPRIPTREGGQIPAPLPRRRIPKVPRIDESATG